MQLYVAPDRTWGILVLATIIQYRYFISVHSNTHDPFCFHLLHQKQLSNLPRPPSLWEARGSYRHLSLGWHSQFGWTTRQQRHNSKAYMTLFTENLNESDHVYSRIS